jgi:hypothetical protein
MRTMKSGPEAAAEFRRNEMAKIEGASIDVPSTDQDWKEALKHDMATRLIEYEAAEIAAGRMVVFHNGTLGVL